MQNELGHSQVRNLDFLIIYCGLYIHFRYCEINIGVAYRNTFLHFHLPLSTVIQCIGNHKVGTFLLWPEGGTDSVQMNNAKYCQPEGHIGGYKKHLQAGTSALHSFKASGCTITCLLLL